MTNASSLERRLRAEMTGDVLFDATVPCLPQDAKFLSSCTIKVPDTGGEQLAFQGVFTPTTVQNESGNVGSAHPAAQSPALTLVGFRGDLRYYRSLADPVEDNEFDIALGTFDFWRATAGVTFRW